MPVYRAPVDEIRFLLHDVLEAPRLATLPGYADATSDVMDSLIEEAAKIAEEVLFPLNASGDVEGCFYENGVVRTPKGFKEAYATFREAGWTGLSCDPNYGGQGLPLLLNFVVDEVFSSANLSFGMYPGLSHGAYNAIHKHANDALKAEYLPKLVDGTWSGTMCLTEPHCGTDLGLIRTKAEPQADGSYKITGTKIFISAGEHDLTENIIHLVLARLPDAPSGVKGISLFLVPKFMPKDGAPGPRNTARCGSIEHKMGIKASATCVMNFDNATGYLVGTLNRGLPAMFTMMNEARLAVALQGLGIAEIAYQNAVAYARERLQGRALSGAKAPEKPADPLFVHPDIRRMLLTMKAQIEPARYLAYLIGLRQDEEARHPDAAVRAAAADMTALFTPVLKAYLTDLGSECANLAVQIYGGHGYVRDHGVEQYVRDARICQIYEGANGIQALDLVGRKLPEDYGRLLRSFFHPAQALIEKAMGAGGPMGDYAGLLAKAFGKLQQATLLIAQKGLADPEEAAAAASDYLRLFGLVALGYGWLKLLEAAQGRLAAGDGRKEFLEAKFATAGFFFLRILPQANALFLALSAGKKSLMALPEAAF